MLSQRHITAARMAKIRAAVMFWREAIFSGWGSRCGYRLTPSERENRVLLRQKPCHRVRLACRVTWQPRLTQQGSPAMWVG